MNNNADIDVSNAQILVVDDTPHNLDLLYAILNCKGYKIAAAPSGEIALSIAPSLKPDLILMDVMMPKLDGFETCRLFKADPNLQDIPIIFITAKTSLDDIVAGFDAGGVDYISKPIKAREVHARVHTHLHSRALMKQQVVLNDRLKDLETRSRCIINEVTDAVVTVRPPGIIESANPAALSLFGYTSDEMLGKPFVELLAQKHHDNYCGHFIQEQLQAPPISENAIEVTGKKHDGSTLPVDLTIKQLDLNYPLYLCFIHDLSIHKNILNELTRLSNLDGLTNIANRRRFDEEYEQGWHEAQRKQLPLSLIMVDIDYFKQFNDAYGHQVGDECLQKVAKALEKSVIRNADLVARFGGEEFVLILPNTDSKGAITIAQTILDNVKQLDIEHRLSGVAQVLTTSLGIATLTPVKNDVLSTLITQADQALYQAKETGRDRWVLFKET